MTIIRKVAIAAGLALAAEAFMIPSTITLPGLTVDKEGELSDRLSPLRIPDSLPDQLKNLNLGVSKPHEESVLTHMMLNCPGCSFRPEGLSAEDAAEETANDLILDFTISEDRKALEVNGRPIYPLDTVLKQGALPFAHQSARENFETEDGRTGEVDRENKLSAPRQLDYVFGERETPAADGTEARLIDAYFHITGLGEESIHVHNIDIRMLSDESGNLHLVHVVDAPTPDAEPNGRTHMAEELKAIKSAFEKDDCIAADHHSRIAGMMCRLRAQIKQKVEDWRLLQPNPQAHPHMKKPCPGRFRAHPAPDGTPMVSTGNWGPRPPMRGGPAKFMPHAHHPGHHHRHHRHGLIHGLAFALRGFVLGFVVPVLIGVIAGMTASLVGMVVGTLIAWVWVKLVRGGKRGNCSARQEERAMRFAEEEEVLLGEKDVMLEHAPAYEEVVAAPPVYVEKE